MHWLLDVVFKDDLSRYRAGNGAKNMAVVRRFSLNLIRANKAKGSIKTKRKAAGWDPASLLEILQQYIVNLDSAPWRRIISTLTHVSAPRVSHKSTRPPKFHATCCKSDSPSLGANQRLRRHYG
jgi:hypothetical protein